MPIEPMHPHPAASKVSAVEARGDAASSASQAAAIPSDAPGTTIERPVIDPLGDTRVGPDRPWLVIVWNDPVNLMSFVTFVFQKLFGYSKEKATSLMLDVHHKGRAVVSSGTRERAETDVYRLHQFGLWATLEQSG